MGYRLALSSLLSLPSPSVSLCLSSILGLNPECHTTSWVFCHCALSQPWLTFLILLWWSSFALFDRILKLSKCPYFQLVRELFRGRKCLYYSPLKLRSLSWSLNTRSPVNDVERIEWGGALRQPYLLAVLCRAFFKIIYQWRRAQPIVGVGF